MDSSTDEQLVGQHEWPKEIEAKSLYRALEQVKDGRGRRGVRYSVAFVLTLILLGKLVGEVKLSGIAKSGALAQRVDQAAFGAGARHAAVCRNLYLRAGTCGCRRGDGGGARLFDATAFPQAKPDRDATRVARASRADAASGPGWQDDAWNASLMSEPINQLTTCWRSMKSLRGRYWLSVRSARKRMRSARPRPCCKAALSAPMRCRRKSSSASSSIACMPMCCSLRKTTNRSYMKISPCILKTPRPSAPRGVPVARRPKDMDAWKHAS
jgi:hypothetical protein